MMPLNFNEDLIPVGQSGMIAQHIIYVRYRALVIKLIELIQHKGQCSFSQFLATMLNMPIIPGSLTQTMYLAIMSYVAIFVKQDS